MRKCYFIRVVFICVTALFMMPTWAVETLACDIGVRIDNTDIEQKFTVRAGRIGVAKAQSDEGYSAMQDVYLNECPLDIYDEGFPYIDIERVVSLSNEDIVVLHHSVQAAACFNAYSLLAIKPDGSTKKSESFHYCGDIMQLTDFKVNGDQLTFVDKSGEILTTYRYKDGWVDCEPCEPYTSSSYVDSLGGKLSIHANPDELDKILLNDREIDIAGKQLNFVEIITQDHQSNFSPKVDGKQFVLIRKELPPTLGCSFRYILLTIRPDKSVQISDEFGNCSPYLHATVDEHGLSIRFHSVPNEYTAQTVTLRDGKLSIEGALPVAKPYKPEYFNSLQAVYRDLADKLYRDVHNIDPEKEADIDEFADTIEEIAQVTTHTLHDNQKMLSVQLPSVNDFFENKPTCKDQFDCTTAFYFIDQGEHYLPAGLPLESIGSIKPDLKASPPSLSVRRMNYKQRPPVEETLCYVLKSLAPGYPEEFFRADRSLCLDIDKLEQPQAANDDQCLSYDSVANLVGTIVRATYPGPPNYESIEEGDEAETGLYLDLNEPVCTGEATDEVNEARSGVKRIQLVIASKDMYERLSALQGSIIALQGRLFSSITGHHHAPLLLEDLSLLETKSVKIPLQEPDK